MVVGHLRICHNFAYDNNFILRKRKEILHPNALIFLTGPLYDKYITYSYPNIKYYNFKSFDIRQLAIIDGIPGIEKAIGNLRGTHISFKVNILGIMVDNSQYNSIEDIRFHYHSIELTQRANMYGTKIMKILCILVVAIKVTIANRFQ